MYKTLGIACYLMFTNAQCVVYDLLHFLNYLLHVTVNAKNLVCII